MESSVQRYALQPGSHWPGQLSTVPRAHGTDSLPTYIGRTFAERGDGYKPRVHLSNLGSAGGTKSTGRATVCLRNTTRGTNLPRHVTRSFPLGPLQWPQLLFPPCPDSVWQPCAYRHVCLPRLQLCSSGSSAQKGCHV